MKDEVVVDEVVVDELSEQEKIDAKMPIDIEKVSTPDMSSFSPDELKDMQRMAKEYMLKNGDEPFVNKEQYRRFGMKRTKKGAIHGGKRTGAKHELKRMFKGIV